MPVYKLMQILRKILILISAFFFLISPSVFGAAPAELKESIEKKSKEIEEINNQIKETQKNLDVIQDQGQTLKNDIKQTDYSINNLNLSIRSGEITIDKLSLEINSIQYEIVDAEEEIVLKREAIAKILQEFQRTEDETPLIIFLRNKSLSDSVSEIQSLADLNTGLTAEINGLKVLKDEMADNLTQSTIKKQSTEIEADNLKNKKIILGEVKKQKSSLLSQTKNQEKIYQQILSDLEKKQIEIAEEITILEENLRLSFDPNLLPTKRPGVLGYPVAGEPYVTQEYGNTAFAQWAYKTKFHNGIDLKAPLGTPILAAEDGEVMAVGNNGKVQYGKFILIKHNNNLATLYAHLSRQIVQKGNLVKKGQVIGYSGNTGYCYPKNAAHLHFSVYWALSVDLKSFSGYGLVPVGVTVNPEDYL